MINIVDTTMRDGSHSISHSFTEEQVTAIAKGLEGASVPFIELSHGDGIAGSTFNYGFSKVDEMELLKAASSVIKNSKLLVLLLPGIGTIETLKKAVDSGATGVRVATHVTEADISQQHIDAAKKMNLFTVGFLMMVHMAPPSVAAEQAKLMESYGADYINLADSAGFLLPEQVKEYVTKVKEAVKLPVGFHCHNNLGVAAANSLAAVEAGATYIDVSMRGFGA
ncbi:MAG: 4-hydroxy-2-oxovalerate aldolase, partial [Oscillospiraceae bacterium]|nr:4-hydroxy-2-oxovalerate aldolase [Oscillospiraceae bacterium]